MQKPCSAAASLLRFIIISDSADSSSQAPNSLIPLLITPPECLSNTHVTSLKAEHWLQVPYYDYALDLILDTESPSNEILNEEQHELVEGAAEMLYGLVHVRYILTARGMAAMFQKYKAAEFGRCPRVSCDGQSCLPVGTSDVPRSATVKLFCPKCEDIYFPRSKYQVRTNRCIPTHRLLRRSI